MRKTVMKIINESLPGGIILWGDHKQGGYGFIPGPQGYDSAGIGRGGC